ncbi:MAG TPA: hypothetical protein VGG73_11070 [Vicinamibacterales bacterium]
MTGAPQTGAEIVVPLHSRRRDRLELLQKLQDVIPAAGLIGVAWQALTSGAVGLDLALGVIEFVTGTMLIATFLNGALELSHRAPATPELATHSGSRVDWSKIWAAAVLFAEAAERWHTHHRVAGPTILTAVVTLGLGIFSSWFTARHERRRTLRVTQDHLYVGGAKFRRFQARWDEIAAIELTATHAIIRTSRGRRRRLNLRDLDHAPAVRSALQQAQLRLTGRKEPMLAS